MSTDVNKILIPSTIAVIALDNFNGVEFTEDLADLALNLSQLNNGLKEKDEVEKATEFANYLNTKWAEQLGTNKISPGYAIRIVDSVMRQIKELKKNSEDIA